MRSMMVVCSAETFSFTKKGKPRFALADSSSPFAAAASSALEGFAASRCSGIWATASSSPVRTRSLITSGCAGSAMPSTVIDTSPRWPAPMPGPADICAGSISMLVISFAASAIASFCRSCSDSMVFGSNSMVAAEITSPEGSTMATAPRRAGGSCVAIMMPAMTPPTTMSSGTPRIARMNALVATVDLKSRQATSMTLFNMAEFLLRAEGGFGAGILQHGFHEDVFERRPAEFDRAHRLTTGDGAHDVLRIEAIFEHHFHARAVLHAVGREHSGNAVGIQLAVERL